MSKTITINSRLKWPDVKDDYVMMVDGHTIGRVRRDGTSWEWYIAIPMAVPNWARGTTVNLEESQRALVTAWLRLLKEFSADRVERALELQRAAETRLNPQRATEKIKARPAVAPVESQSTIENVDLPAGGNGVSQATIQKIEPPTIVKEVDPQPGGQKVELQTIVNKIEPTSPLPAPAKGFEADRQAAVSKTSPPTSARNSDMFYFPPVEEKL